ncbi:hypothetical protein CFP56_013552 [Quercus suber]|uniref:Nodulin-like domain-containing protein n=1 Tax=Quercus suber TaxID=58331 RepID=A0AAW0KSS0_QUESU
MESGGGGCGFVGVDSMALALGETRARSRCVAGSKAMQERKARLALWLSRVVEDNEHRNAIALFGDFIKQMSKSFAQVVRMDEGVSVGCGKGVVCGASSKFLVHSSEVKSILGYSQQLLTLLEVANDSKWRECGIACNKLPPWFLLLVGVVCGASSKFLVHSSEVKSILGYSQQLLTLLEAAIDSKWRECGIACNKLPPWFLLLVGTLLCFLLANLITYFAIASDNIRVPDPLNAILKFRLELGILYHAVQQIFCFLKLTMGKKAPNNCVLDA